MKKHFALFYARGPNWLPGKPLPDQPLRDHLNYMRTLKSDGIVKMGGPFEDGSGGLGVVEADAVEDVHELIDRDPAIRSGVLTVEFFAWDRIV